MHFIEQGYHGPWAQAAGLRQRECWLPAGPLSPAGQCAWAPQVPRLHLSVRILRHQVTSNFGVTSGSHWALSGEKEQTLTDLHIGFHLHFTLKLWP